MDDQGTTVQPVLEQSAVLATPGKTSDSLAWTQSVITTDPSGDSHLVPMSPGILHPFARRYMKWAGLIACLVLYSTFASWFIWGFVPRPSFPLVMVQTIIDIVFMIDIGLRFRTTYVDPMTFRLVQDPKKIARRYLTHGFIPDVISTIPYNFFWYICVHHPALGWTGEVVRFLAVFRLYRLKETFHYMSRLQKENFTTYFLLRMTKLFLLIVLSGHIAAAVMTFLARRETTISGDPTGCWLGASSFGGSGNWQEWPIFKKYVVTFYWSVMTLSSIGYGDLLPVTVLERAFVALYGVWSMGLLAYALGNMTVMLVRENDRTARYHDKMRLLTSFSHRAGLPAHLRNELGSHVALEMRVDKERPDLLEDFPHHLRAQVLRQQYRSLVEGTYIFQDCSSAFLDQIVGEMKLELYVPNSVVVTEGDVPQSLFIVAKGSVVREKPLNEDGSESSGNSTELAVLGPGSVFSKVAVLCNVPQLFTVRTREVCELLKLDKSDLARILQAYPKDSRQMLDNLKRRVKDRNGASQRELQEMAHDLSDVIWQQDAGLSAVICRAAAAGNMPRLQELLGDPELAKVTDHDGRTPLHLAAAKGYTACIELLVGLGADVNAKDDSGSSPLLEAVRGGHHGTVEILLREGAQLGLREPGSVLCDAVLTGNMDLLRLLLNCGADANATNYVGRTPLHVAAISGNAPAAELLLERGASLDSKDDRRSTPLDEARALGNTRFLETASTFQTGKGKQVIS